jgi:hypothetical protein
MSFFEAVANSEPQIHLSRNNENVEWNKINLERRIVIDFFNLITAYRSQKTEKGQHIMSRTILDRL